VSMNCLSFVMVLMIAQACSHAMPPATATSNYQ